MAKRPQPRVSKIGTYPAPVGGLNVADSLAVMPPTDATVLHNMICQPYGLEVRKGNVRHATGLGAEVETLVEHATAAATSGTKLYAFAGDSMFEITAPGNAARVASLTGLSNAIWDGVSISNASGFNQTLYNGVDNGILINNSFTVSRITQDLTGTPPAGTIYGVDPKNLRGGTVHQKRIWLIQVNSTKAWFLAPEAIYGTATMFDFGSIFQKGGKLLALASWTLDSGTGIDDLFVAISSLGEIAIYTGTDPASGGSGGGAGGGYGNQDWVLKGVFNTGAPLGHRCTVKVEGDLLVLTQFGVLSMTEAISRNNTGGAVSDAYASYKIQYLLQELAEDLYGGFGWQMQYWANKNLLMVNVPVYSGSGQFVQSTLTKGWSQFDNWDAQCWASLNGVPVYGDADGNVWRALEGYTDNSIQVDAGTITVGDAIYAEVQTSFNFFQSAAAVKHAKMVRPTFMGSATVPYRIRVNPEFSYDYDLAAGVSGSISESVWGTDLWGEAVWAGSQLSTSHTWVGVTGVGSGFALRLSFQVARPVLWTSFDIMYEEGTGI